MSNTLLRTLQTIVGPDGVLSGPGERAAYQSDAYPLEKALPLATVLPRTTEQVSLIVQACAAAEVPFAPRGAGTGKAGGTTLPGGVLIGVSRMTRILEIDLRNRRLTAQSGVVNTDITKAVSADGFLYAPDPSSGGACTLAGNIANNAGGPHTLKYGVTANHVLGMEWVLPDGEVVQFGDKTEDAPGLDLLGLALGSEGTLGIVTQATVRLVKQPAAVRTLLAIFHTIADATECVTRIMASGIVPAALEMMDAVVLQSVEAAFHFGFPSDAGAILIIELDGAHAGIDDDTQAVGRICTDSGARLVRAASTAKERGELWMARKKAVGTLGRLAPSCVTQDCVVPRATLPHVLATIGDIGRTYDVVIANVFHAGDGNLHPIILFDERDEQQTRRVLDASRAILELCVGVGGTLTGEHGIGVEKRDFMPLLFSPATLTAMEQVRAVFNPTGLCNPDKVLPSSHGCAYEVRSDEVRPSFNAVAV